MLRRQPLCAAFLAILVLVAGCLETHRWVEREKPWNQNTLAESDCARIERNDGTQIILEEVRIRHEESGDILTGREKSGGNHQIQIKLASIRTLEVREADTGRLVSGILIGIVALAAIGLFLFGPFSPSA